MQILRRTPDQVIKVWHPNHGECLYLIEIQKRIDRRMAKRIAVESLALHQQTDLPVAHDDPNVVEHEARSLTPTIEPRLPVMGERHHTLPPVSYQRSPTIGISLKTS